MFQGIQAVALPMVQEFGYTKEIEDRVLAPLPVSLVALEKVAFGALQGLLAACIVFPIAAVVHAAVDPHQPVRCTGSVLLTLVPLACVACSALGLTFGTIFDPRNVPLMFGIVILPLTFLGGTYYAWTTLSPVDAVGRALAADPGAGQPAGLHQRGLAGGAHDLGRPHDAVGGLPGADRVHALFLWLGTTQLHGAA